MLSFLTIRIMFVHVNIVGNHSLFEEPILKLPVSMGLSKKMKFFTRMREERSWMVFLPS